MTGPKTGGRSAGVQEWNENLHAHCWWLQIRGRARQPGRAHPKIWLHVKYDNEDCPVTGKDPGGADTIAVKLIDANQIESTSKKGREVLYTSKVEVSQDRKVMTITTKDKNPDGEPFDNLQVDDRQ